MPSHSRRLTSVANASRARLPFTRAANRIGSVGPRVQQCRAGSRRAVDSVACAVEQRDRVGQQHAREQPRRRREERELRRAARLARPPDHARDEPVRRLVETHLLPRVRAPLRGRAEAGRERGVLEGEGLAAPAEGFGEGSEEVRVDSRGRRDRSAAARARGSGGARRRGRRTRGRTSPWRPLRRRRRAARSCRGRSFARSSSSRRRTQSSGRSRWRRRGALSRAEEACLSSRRRQPTRPSPEPPLGALPQPARPLGATCREREQDG